MEAVYSLSSSIIKFFEESLKAPKDFCIVTKSLSISSLKEKAF
jgi:hypothetical protein